jgi:YYY domain-containing protein
MPILVLVALTVVSAALARRKWPELLDFFKRERALVFSIEGVFLLFFLGFALLRSGVSAIGHTEQPMDFAFLNASMLASSFPPEDPWLSGNGISYYYFGYLTLGLPGVISGISSSVVYNLALVLLPAMAAAGVMNLVSTVVVRAGASLKVGIALGVVGALMLSVFGNLEGLLEMIHSWGLGSDGFWESVGVKGLETQSGGSSFFPNENWWWWRSSRVIDTVVAGSSLDFTIQEYPFFSSYLGDLHPHVMSIPFVLLFLALCLNLLADTASLTISWIKQRWFDVTMIGLTLGALGFINAWDLPVFLAVFMGVIALKTYGGLRNGWRRDYALGALAVIAIVLGFAVVPFLPYYGSFSGQVKGIEAVASPGASVLHLTIVWGVFFAALAPFLLLHLSQWREWLQVRRPLVVASSMALAPIALWFVITLVRGDTDQISDRLLVALPLALVLAMLLVRALKAQANQDSLPSVFTLGVLAVGVALLMGSELFYVVDVFNTRMNTMFKLYYQAWILLAVATPVAIYYWARAASRGGVWIRRAGVSWGVVLGLVALGALYLPIGMAVTVGDSAGGPYTLDGAAFLSERSSGEHAAIEWLKNNADAEDGIVEAVGNDYTEYGRVASFTGLPTVLNWVGHELQWRGSSEPIDGRAEDVATVYQSEDVNLVEDVLARYDVRYVIFGSRERTKYQVQSLDHLSALLTPVFSPEGFTIYEVRDTDA